MVCRGPSRVGVPWRPFYDAAMNSVVGGVLVVLALGIGWRSYGWPGVLLAVTVTVFWLMLEFSRAMRAMKNAGQAPVGRVPSAVMLNARLQRGMTMQKVIGLTRSFGVKAGGAGTASAAAGRNDDDVWRWQDDGGSHVTLTFAAGKLAAWQLHRPVEAETAAADAPSRPLN